MSHIKIVNGCAFFSIDVYAHAKRTSQPRDTMRCLRVSYTLSN